MERKKSQGIIENFKVSNGHIVHLTDTDEDLQLSAHVVHFTKEDTGS